MLARVCLLMVLMLAGCSGGKKDAGEKPTDTKLKPAALFESIASDGSALPKWLHTISAPVWDAEGNEVAKDRAKAAVEKEMQKLIGREFKWKLKIRSIEQTGVYFDLPTHYVADGWTILGEDRFRKVDINFTPDDKFGIKPPLPIEVKDEDFIASLRPDDELVVRGKFETARPMEGQDGPFWGRFNITLDVSEVKRP